jgi:hypothetical protein
LPDLAYSSVGNVTTAWTVQNLQYGFTQFAFTATSASPAVFTAPWASLVSGQTVQLSGASLPAGFTQGVLYYSVNVTNVGASVTFNLALTPGGAGINSTSTGSGTVSQIVGVSSVGYD